MTYINIHNANVLLGRPTADYAGVPYLIGTTCAPHLFLLSFLSLFLGGNWAAETVALIGAIAYALGLVYLALKHSANMFQLILVLLLGLGMALVPHQLFNGLETGLAMAGLTWTLAFVDDLRPVKRWGFPLLCGQLPFLRPELAAVSVLLFTVRWFVHFNEGRNPVGAFKALGADGFVAAAVALPWIALYMVVTGSPYALTAGVKKAFFAEGAAALAIKLKWSSLAVKSFASDVGFFSLSVPFLFLTRAGWAGLAFMAVFFFAYVIHFPGALGHYEHRYLYVFVPFLVYGPVSCIHHRLKGIRIGANILLLAGVVEALLSLPGGLDVHRNNCNFTAVELKGVTEWCRENLPVSARIMVHDAGYISAETEFSMVDIVGIKTPSNTAIHKKLTGPSGGLKRTEAIHRIALKHRPDFLVVLSGWERIYHIAEGLEQNGWQVALLRYSPRGYGVYALAPPEGSLPAGIRSGIILLRKNVSEFARKSTGNRTEDGWALWENGYISDYFRVYEDGNYSVSILAKGTGLKGVYPAITLRLGALKHEWQINSTDWAVYTWEGRMTSGRHEVRISFDNDDYIPPEDRNLFIKDVTIKKSDLR